MPIAPSTIWAAKPTATKSTKSPNIAPPVVITRLELLTADTRVEDAANAA